MEDVQYVDGAKILLTRAFCHVRKKVGMCEGFATVADVPQLLQSPNRAGLMPGYAFRVVSMVLTFIGPDDTLSCESGEASSERYIVGDPTGCISMDFPEGRSVPRNVEGNTFIAINIAVVVSGHRIYLGATEDMRLIPCGSGDYAWARRDNDITRDHVCVIRYV
ncbi:hypothetical protein X943_000237 [Babesia divergens]|uniref:Uncharacterized protein n=1 Tax=Babesia divergens TaxID=32595 RepID=A0AAD9GJG6_BABDI|nr:hypothetical protein X943_000237 [Babesia divergens]